MSFSSDTKDELARIEPESVCCMLAELAAIVSIGGTIGLMSAGRMRLTVESENAATARRVYSLFKRLFDVRAELTTLRHTRLGGRNTYRLTLHGDEKMISQLVSILLDNAVKYSDAGGEIRVMLEKQGRTVHLSVFNTVESISQRELEHLFDRFYRTDRSRNSKTGGYGIGLSIASAVAAAHKGKILASSRDGHSLLITVILPA